MKKGDKQQERTHRSVLSIKNGKVQAFCDTKLQTSVIGIDGKYDFRTNEVIEVDELPNLNKQFEKAAHEAHREFWAKHGSEFRDKILVCNTNANTKALKADGKFRCTFQYLLSFREKRHMFNDLADLETHPLMHDMITIFDQAMMHALDNYSMADMVTVNNEDE